MATKKINGWMCILIAMLAAACSPAPAEQPASQTESEAAPSDPDAELYRMFFDDENGKVQVREFVGQLRLADYEAIFGDVDEMAEDENGNKVAGPIVRDGLIWGLVMDPSRTGISLVSKNPDGTLSNALDLDGDRVADIVDIQMADGRRYSFVTESLGLGIIKDFLNGEDPLCGSDFAGQIGLPDFGCETSDDGGLGGDGGGIDTSVGQLDIDAIDPFADICEGYDSPGPTPQVRASVKVTNNTWTDPTGHVLVDQRTEYITAPNGSHLYTHRVIVYFADENLDGTPEEVGRTTETVFADGNGYRSSTVRRSDGTTSTTNESFTADVDEKGRYDSGQTNPPERNPSTEQRTSPPPGHEEEVEPPPSSGTGSDTNPGPDGSLSLDAYCEARGDFVSGVERAAATDPTAFGVSCGELVGAPAGGDDCSIIDWAGPADFLGALEPSGNNCGPFEQPDPTTGNCSGTDIESMLRGMTAAVASANLQGVSICGGTVCRPFDGLAPAAGNRQPISAEADSPPQVLSGTVRSDTLCWRGPGPDYEVVSSLFRDTVVVILGIGEDGGWYVVENPVYEGVACWAPEEDIELSPDFDPQNQTVFAVPPLPSSGSGDGGGGSSGGGGGGTSPSAPAAPSNLAASVTCAYPTYSVKLTWKDNSNNESGFKIYRGGLLIATVGPNTTQFTDNNPPNSGGNNYSVRAYNAAGDSAAIAVKDAGCIF